LVELPTGTMVERDLPHDSLTTDYCENLAAMFLLWPEHVD
jgi:hypothetical protein